MSYYRGNMQHIGSVMWCNLISTSTDMPSHIQRQRGVNGGKDMNVWKKLDGKNCTVAPGNQITRLSTILSGLDGTQKMSPFDFWCFLGEWQTVFMNSRRNIQTNNWALESSSGQLLFCFCSCIQSLIDDFFHLALWKCELCFWGPLETSFF